MHRTWSLRQLVTAWPAPAALGGIVALFIASLREPAGAIAVALAGAAASLVLARLEIQRLRGEFVRMEALLADAKYQHGLIDPETGLGILASLRLDWGRQLARYQRHGERFAVAVIDIREASTGAVENPSADLLCVATDRLRTLTRIEDSIYRIAPARLAVMLCGADTEGAESFLERAAPLLKVIEVEQGQPIAVSVATDVIDWREGLGPFPEHRLLWDESAQETATRMFKRWSGQRGPRDPAEDDRTTAA